MSFLAGFAIAIILYYVITVILWIILDSNILLWYKDRFGNSISVLRGQVVWITGASSGIGKGLALNLAKHGVKVVLSARKVDQLKAVQAECLGLSNGLLAEKDILILPMDVLDIKSHEKCLNTVLNHFGKLDILVNNAGRSQRADWEKIDVQVDRELFELDVFATINLSRVVVRYFLKERCGGHIAATSSIAGLGPVPFSATYCAAKSALNAYLNCLRLEHPNIDVTIFAPGPVATDFLKVAFTGTPNEIVGKSTENQKRITAEHAGHLFGVSIANKMDLTWCALFPINVIAYCMQSYILGIILRKVMSGKTIQKLRDGKH